MKFLQRTEKPSPKFRAVDVLTVPQAPAAETLWTPRVLDVLEAASKNHNGSQDFFDRVDSSVALRLIAPERLDAAKTRFNIQSLKADLRQRERGLVGNPSGGLFTYLRMLFSLYILEPGQEYIFEEPDFADMLEETFSIHSPTYNPRFIFNLGVYLTLFPEKRFQMKLDQWSELVEYVQALEPGEYLAENLIGLRLISPAQFSEIPFSIQPAVEDLQQKIKEEIEFLRTDPLAVSSLAEAIGKLALLTAQDIQVTPGRGLVIRNPKAVSMVRTLPERNTV